VLVLGLEERGDVLERPGDLVVGGRRIHAPTIRVEGVALGPTRRTSVAPDLDEVESWRRPGGPGEIVLPRREARRAEASLADPSRRRSRRVPRAASNRRACRRDPRLRRASARPRIPP